ncbi:MAG TPA: hypothetical protein VGI55_13040, partial [Solirubrobacteraceae bacterium]
MRRVRDLTAVALLLASTGVPAAAARSAAELTPSRLVGASAVMFLLTTGELPMSPADKRAPVAFVRDGGGLIGFHSATWRNPIQVTLASGGIAWAVGLASAPSCHQRT